MQLYPSYTKRVLDFSFAFVLILILSPIMAVTSLILILQNQGTPFFTQLRPGYLEKQFTLIKFKTMTDAKDDNGNLLPDKERLTFFGKWLRKLSLDELPQLYNVLVGDMSLVGPRPLLIKYLPLYTPEQRRRHSVRPGITGWAQVNGRNSISWKRKFDFDIFYVENVSFALDLKILAMTFVKVLRRQGIDQSNERPMQPFNGSN